MDDPSILTGPVDRFASDFVPGLESKHPRAPNYELDPHQGVVHR